MRAFIILSTALLIAAPVSAQDGVECFSKYTKYNVCEKAREIQREAAPAFPMKMSANITVSMVAAAGLRIIFYAIWNTTKSDLDASRRAGGAEMMEFEKKVTQMTRNAVCSQEVPAAFLRLGGEMQYVYKTQDGHVVLSPIVKSDDCPPRGKN